MRNSSSLDWLRFMHTPNDYRVSRKKPQVALNNVKNKLIRIIVALVRKKVPYDQNTYKYYEEREVIERKKNEKLIYC